MNDPTYQVTGFSTQKLDNYLDEIFRSGFPGIRARSPKAGELLIRDYVNNIVQHDFEENGFTAKEPETLRSWMRAYAAAIATTTSYKKIIDTAMAMSLLDVTKEQLTDFDVNKHIGKINSDLIVQLMESLVYQSLIVYADALDAHLCHFRDSKGRHEIDFILQKGRKLILFEVKTNSNVKDSYVRHLN